MVKFYHSRVEEYKELLYNIHMSMIPSIRAMGVILAACVVTAQVACSQVEREKELEIYDRNEKHTLRQTDIMAPAYGRPVPKGLGFAPEYAPDLTPDEERSLEDFRYDQRRSLRQTDIMAPAYGQPVPRGLGFAPEYGSDLTPEEERSIEAYRRDRSATLRRTDIMAPSPEPADAPRGMGFSPASEPKGRGLGFDKTN